MQVSAYKIARFYGIDALANFHSEATAAEVEQCREDYRLADAKSIVIRSFNDGNNGYDVILHTDTWRAYRNDHDVEVTSDYVAIIGETLARFVEANSRILHG
jgi:exo-beta-1,3-glucanase (GH17 family)